MLYIRDGSAQAHTNTLTSTQRPLHTETQVICPVCNDAYLIDMFVCTGRHTYKDYHLLHPSCNPTIHMYHYITI